MDKSKFLFASLSALISDIAWEVLKEGHDVCYYIEGEKERDIADGFVPKSKD
jgi:phosphoribosylamine--glycine ligase